MMLDLWNSLPIGDKHAAWEKMSASDKLGVVDLSDLSPQLEGLIGYRVEVIRMDGSKARFNVGRSTGWKPCHLELHNARSWGGNPADRRYQSVTIIRKVR